MIFSMFCSNYWACAVGIVSYDQKQKSEILPLFLQNFKMATRNDLDALVVQVEGLDLEENQAGHGAYGCVFRVTVNGKDCIAKKLHTILLQERSLGQRGNIVTKFRNECHILSVLHHPNIVGFVGVHYGHDKNDISLIMERLHSDLADFVETHRDTNIATRIHILYDVSKGLQYLHSLTPPLIHRDLTAPNILLTEDLTAKIGDLGVSRYVFFCNKGFFK